MQCPACEAENPSGSTILRAMRSRDRSELYAMWRIQSGWAQKLRRLWPASLETPTPLLL